ncbi:MAG: hypothetical protein ACRCSK_05390 [Fusobacteriaceae bacterium]
MLFYDEFLKKLNAPYSKKFSDMENFKLEIKRTVAWLSTSIPLLMIAIYQFYVIAEIKYSHVNLLFALVTLFMGGKQLKTIYDYKIKIDTVAEILYFYKIKINFSDIKSCVLKENAIGKRKNFVVTLDIVTNDSKQFIIPLMMQKKFDFVMLFKTRLKEKFSVSK